MVVFSFITSNLMFEYGCCYNHKSFKIKEFTSSCQTWQVAFIITLLWLNLLLLAPLCNFNEDMGYHFISFFNQAWSSLQCMFQCVTIQWPGIIFDLHGFLCSNLHNLFIFTHYILWFETINCTLSQPFIFSHHEHRKENSSLLCLWPNQDKDSI